MSKVAGFVIGAIEIGVGIATDNPMLIVQGSMTVVSQAVVDLTAAKQPARAASEMTIQLGEQPRVLLLGETFTPGSLVDGFDYGGKYGTDWEVLVIRLADHKCAGLTGFFVNDQYFLYTGDGLVGAFDDQLEIYFRADTSATPLPAIVTANGKGWTSADIGGSGCDVIVAYKADKANDKHPGWPGGRPRFGFVVKGAYCYDPRKDSTVVGGSGPHRDNDPATWEWSENAAICRYKWVRGVYANDDTSDPTQLLIGRGLTASEAPPENIIAAANTCDEQTPLVYPGQWSPTSTTYPVDCTVFSRDGATLYTAHGTAFSAFYLPTRSEFANATLTEPAGGTLAMGADGYIYFAAVLNGLWQISPAGVEGQVMTQPDMGMIGSACGSANGDVWVFPHSFDPNKIGRLAAAGGWTGYAVNFNANAVFPTASGGAIALGTTSGNVLAIGPAGAVGTLIDTTAYGTSGGAWGYDPDDGAHYVVRQGNYLFLIAKAGLTISLAVDTGSGGSRIFEAFAATPVGSPTFWNDDTEYLATDLSVVRNIAPLPFDPTDVGGFPTGGSLHDPINNAQLTITNSATGITVRLLDRNGSYRIAGPIYSTQQFIDVEGLFAAATAGNIVTREGSVELAPGVAQSVVASFTDADLLTGSKVSWNQGFLSQANQEWVNTVVSKYVEPDQKWNDHEAPPARVNADIVADGKPREAQLTLRLVRYLAQAQRIAEITRRQGRRWGRATVTLGPRFCELEEGDWVTWQSDRRFAGATKTFRIDGVTIDIKWQVTLTLREISADDYAIADNSFTADHSRPTTTPPPPGIGTPTAGNWTLNAITLDSAGASVPALEISGSAADDPYVQAIIFEYWKSDGVTDPTIAPDSIAWTSVGGSSAPDTTKVDVTSIAGAATYYAAVSYVVDGITGDRLVLGPVTVADYNPTPILMLEDNVTLLTLEDDATAFNLG